MDAQSRRLPSGARCKHCGRVFQNSEEVLTITTKTGEYLDFCKVSPISVCLILYIIKTRAFVSDQLLRFIENALRAGTTRTENLVREDSSWVDAMVDEIQNQK